jgi:hypothetical protein
MADNALYHALVLNLHQPAWQPGSPAGTTTSRRPRKSCLRWTGFPVPCEEHPDVGRVHLALSGTLLETLSHSDFQSRANGIVDCAVRCSRGICGTPGVIDVLGAGYYHPVLPLVPPGRLGCASGAVARDGAPPVLQQRLPGLLAAGNGLLHGDDPVAAAAWLSLRAGRQRACASQWGRCGGRKLRYRPHVARFGGEEIVVIVRDRDLSNAQESGMELEWFDPGSPGAHSRICDFRRAGDDLQRRSENGGWFRNVTRPAATSGTPSIKPLLDRARANRRRDPAGLHPGLSRPVRRRRRGRRSDRARGTPAGTTGAISCNGAGSPAQKDALTRVDEISQAVQAALNNAAHIGSRNPELLGLLEEAHWRVLRAETSCNFFWGDAWVMRCHADLDQACECLERANARFR